MSQLNDAIFIYGLPKAPPSKGFELHNNAVNYKERESYEIRII